MNQSVLQLEVKNLQLWFLLCKKDDYSAIFLPKNMTRIHNTFSWNLYNVLNFPNQEVGFCFKHPESLESVT